MSFPFRRKPLDRIYLYLHIPKCAGTTLINSLGRLGKKRFVVISDHSASKSITVESVKELVRTNRTTAERLDVIAGHDVFFGMHQVSSRAPFYFTILRDPTERYISHYQYLVDVACGRRTVKDRFVKKMRDLMIQSGTPISLEEFAKRQLKTNIMTHYLAAAIHPTHQVGRKMLSDSSELRDQARDSLNRMQWIGFVENFPADLHTVCGRLKVSPLATSNESITKTLQPQQQVLELIRRNNRLDLEIYDAALELRQSFDTDNRETVVATKR